MTMKKVLTIALTLTLTITGTLTVAAQTGRQLKVYMKGGLVDKVQVATDAYIGHSRTDLNGTVHDDYVSAVVKDAEGRERQYLISQLDSLVMPNGRRVVFIGSQNGNDNGNENENQNQNENGSRPSQRRTFFKGRFPGTVESGNVTFYWQPNDRIRLDAGYASRAEQLTGGGTGASFYFDGADDLDAQNYLVYFPDRSVTIKSVQTQIGANNTDHIGQSGDCGTATATRTSNTNHPSPNTTYNFTLDHKAAYLCFLPYIDNLPSARVEKIVLSGGNIAGTFELAGSGLYNGQNLSKTITLNLVPQKAKDFFLGHSYLSEQDSCAAYMVIAPQGSTTFTASYYITDTLSHISKVFHQTFTFAPAANTVYPIKYHISDKEFRMVDLGLSVNWLNANVDGVIPSDHGTHYDTDEEANAALLSKTVITEWLMPTGEQRTELLEKCLWTWGQYNGINGYIVEAPTESTDDGNRHRIFLPSRSTTQVTPAECLAANSRAVETLIVDMGLPSGTKWAVRNVGAQSSTDYGDYFAWGETETKSSYTSDNYLYGTRNLGENLNISGTQHDAAFVHWGGSWRMPTKTEWEELVSDTCTWTWQAVNGVNGYIITSKKNGNKIFLPAAGTKYEGTVHWAGHGGMYFTANQGGSNSWYAWSLVWNKNHSDKRYFYNANSYDPFSDYFDVKATRYSGHPVRPVMSTAVATSDGMELTILTDSASWRLGDTSTTLYGSLRSTTPIKGEVTVGFVIGDSANITIDETTVGEHNYRSLYSRTATTAGRITYTMSVYDNIGYWYRAFVQTSDTVMYGVARHYGYEMVDLGLKSGTLWANMNLGANVPEEEGYLYAWGETQTKTDYSASTYQFGTTQNIGNNHDISATKYDAAHVLMGNAWRMPTYNEMKELFDSCKWERVTQNSTNGYRVTSKKNGNSIFLPDAGLMMGTSHEHSNSGGSYFTSTQVGNNSEYAYTLSWYSGTKIYHSDTYDPFNRYEGSSSARYRGRSIRAVASLDNIEGDNAYTILTDSATWHLDATTATIYGTMSMLRPIEGFVEVGFIIGDSANIKKDGAAYYSKNVSANCRMETTVPVYDNMGYWYRAYIETDDTIFYGEAKHFGLEMVDLGLPSGTLWANLNVGASWPEEFGKYYAWAETSEKENYILGNYRYYKESRYVNLGDDYNITRTDMDAAHINMGNAWRMPTKKEAQELLDNCTWKWVLENGVNGYLVTSKTNGNSIFLPAAGLKLNGTLHYKDTGGSYWTAVSVGDGNGFANTLSFHNGCKIYYADTYDPFNRYEGFAVARYFGRSVRAVASPNAIIGNRVFDIQTDSATWQLGDATATLYGTVSSKAPIKDGITVGIVVGNDSDVVVSTATVNYNRNVTEVCSFSTTVTITGNMGYWYRAYIEKDGVVKYGKAKHVGWAMVDLGLSSGTLWANMNVQSSRPEEYGKYYAWGEVNHKQDYTEANYLYYDSETNSCSSIGNNGDIAATTFDAAHERMGVEWSIPTTTQWTELLNNCTWKYVLSNGVKGYKVIGPNGYYIFLPSAGIYHDGALSYEGDSGSYWASLISGSNNKFAYTMTWYSGKGLYSHNSYDPYNNYGGYAVFRYYGRPVRAVAAP